MRMKDIIRKSFQPELFIKVGKMEDGEPVPRLLEQVYKNVDSSYSTLVDNENGVIYLNSPGVDDPTILLAYYVTCSGPVPFPNGISLTPLDANNREFNLETRINANYYRLASHTIAFGELRDRQITDRLQKIKSL